MNTNLTREKVADLFCNINKYDIRKYPLYIGQNTISNNRGSDIKLNLPQKT